MKVRFYLVVLLLLCCGSLFAQLVNNGAVLFVGKDGLIAADANYLHKNGNVVNNGKVIIKGDWQNDATNQVFDAKSSGTVVFNSKGSSFGGNPTLFPHLLFEGSGVFYVKAKLLANLSLNIDDAEIQALVPEAITLINDNSLSLVRKQGFINTSLGVDGSFVRYTKAADEYLYPVGASAKLLRFVSVKPKDAAANAVAVSFLDKDASADGYSRSSKTKSVGEINDVYYYVFKRLAGSSGADISFHIPATEKYSSLASWVKNAEWDKVASVSKKTNNMVAPGLNQALVHENANLGLGMTAVFALAQVNNIGQLELFNAFSPDGDGKNDTWEVKNIDAFPDNDLKIFDRSGNLVYTMKGYNSSKYWDGKNVASGTYVYILRVNMDGKDQYHKGSITVVKN